MFDFGDIRSATKAEQIRAFAMEKACDILAGTTADEGKVVRVASKIENFIKTGEDEE